MFPFSFGAKKDRETRLSVLTEREMTLVPRSLLLNRTETLATQAMLVINLQRITILYGALVKTREG